MDKDQTYWDEKSIAESTSRVRTTTTMAAAALGLIFFRVVDGKVPAAAVSRWALWASVVALGASIVMQYRHGMFVIKYYVDMRQGRPEKSLDNMIRIENTGLWASRLFIGGVVAFGWRMLAYHS